MPLCRFSIDSHAWLGILLANGGNVERNCEGGVGRLEVRVWTKKVMDGMELWPKFVFDSDFFAGRD
jgi:hypothetical protein